MEFTIGVIPIKPTPAMFQAWREAEKNFGTFNDCYKAMMDAAPKIVIK